MKGKIRCRGRKCSNCRQGLLRRCGRGGGGRDEGMRISVCFFFFEKKDPLGARAGSVHFDRFSPGRFWRNAGALACQPRSAGVRDCSTKNCGVPEGAKRRREASLATRKTERSGVFLGLAERRPVEAHLATQEGSRFFQEGIYGGGGDGTITLGRSAVPKRRGAQPCVTYAWMCASTCSLTPSPSPSLVFRHRCRLKQRTEPQIRAPLWI